VKFHQWGIWRASAEAAPTAATPAAAASVAAAAPEGGGEGGVRSAAPGSSLNSIGLVLGSSLRGGGGAARDRRGSGMGEGGGLNATRLADPTLAPTLAPSLTPTLAL